MKNNNRIIVKKLIAIIITIVPIFAYASFPVLEKNLPSNDSCDNIILKNGKEISAKIIEINPDFIKYKRCENLYGPLRSIYKSEILMLRYSDGSKDIFSLTDNQKKVKKGINYKSKYRFGISSFFFALWGILSFFLGTFLGFGWFGFSLASSVIAMIVGATSLKSERWGYALAGLIIGSVFGLSSLFALLIY